MPTEKVTAIRKAMEDLGMAAYLFGTEDAHQSEYVAAYWRRIAAMTNFMGSAGTAIITKDKALLWVDGRYYLQGERETKGSSWEIMRLHGEGVPDPDEWLLSHMEKDSILGVDGRTISMDQGEKLLKKIGHRGITINGAHDLIDPVWPDRPAFPTGEIYAHPIEFAGKSAIEKITLVRAEMKKRGVESYYITSLDDIAWVLNMRGSDTGPNPTFYAHVYLDHEKVILFVDKNRVEKNLLAGLLKQDIEVLAYEAVFSYLDKETKYPVFLSPSRVSMFAASHLHGVHVLGTDIITEMKAKKTAEELDHIKNSQEKDALAMFRFMYWLKNKVRETSFSITELDIEDKVLEFRKMGEYFVFPSFATIAAFNENGAFMHYKAAEETAKTIEKNGMLLVDSGGQYFDGTTDITRNYILGDVSKEMKEDYTLVLKAHIQLAMGKFIYGTPGMQVDMLARKPMWDSGKDYKSGTGHGVGYFLSVHEGPQRIGPEKTPVPLEIGMLVTNEPGIYKTGAYGIRIENLMVVVENEKTLDGTFLSFETITFVPIDLDGVLVDRLTETEKNWLNTYHQTTNERLSPFVTGAEKTFLDLYTRSI